MCCAREANIKANSVRGASPEVAECSSTSRIFSPAGVPPGPAVAVTECPRARKDRANFSACVLLPLPSRPSKVINFPRAATSEMIAGLGGLADENNATCETVDHKGHEGTRRKSQAARWFSWADVLGC